MQKTALLILLAITNITFANEIIRKDYEPKPMVEGNRRVDELVEWNKDHPGEIPPLTEQEKYEFFIKKGMPIPGSGASVVDIKNFKMTNTQSAVVNKFNTDQKTQGYHEAENKKAMFLLAMPETAEKGYNTRKGIPFNPHDTHLYEVKSNLPMNYAYGGVPQNLVTKIIGYAPESNFVNKGWSGAVAFFVPSFDGVCALHEINIESTKTAAYIPKEIATYLVNGKLTTMNVVGNKKSGSVYEIEWWDKKFKRTLECATQIYSKKAQDQTIELAKRIDQA